MLPQQQFAEDSSTLLSIMFRGDDKYGSIIVHHLFQIEFRELFIGYLNVVQFLPTPNEANSCQKYCRVVITDDQLRTLAH